MSYEDKQISALEAQLVVLHNTKNCRAALAMAEAKAVARSKFDCSLDLFLKHPDGTLLKNELPVVSGAFEMSAQVKISPEVMHNIMFKIMTQFAEENNLSTMETDINTYLDVAHAKLSVRQDAVQVTVTGKTFSDFGIVICDGEGNTIVPASTITVDAYKNLITGEPATKKATGFFFTSGDQKLANDGGCELAISDEIHVKAEITYLLHTNRDCETLVQQIKTRALQATDVFEMGPDTTRSIGGLTGGGHTRSMGGGGHTRSMGGGGHGGGHTRSMGGGGGSSKKRAAAADFEDGSSLKRAGIGGAAPSEAPAVQPEKGTRKVHTLGSHTANSSLTVA